jgi:hypothetical protein
MPTRDYTIKYVADAQAAIAANKALVASFNDVEAAAKRAEAAVRAVGQNTRTITTTGTKATALAGHLGAVTTAAGSAATALTGVGSAAGSMGGRIQVATGHARGLRGTLMGFSAAALAVHAVRQAMHAISEGLEKAREFAAETAKELLKTRDAVRELRAIKGDKTTTDEANKEVMGLMLASGGTHAEMTRFDEMWESSIVAAKESGHWKLNDKQTEEAKQQVARFAVANGIDPAVMGRLAPSIGIHEDVTSVDQVLGKVGTIHALDTTAVGKFTPLMKVANKLRGFMVRPGGGGAVRSEEELAAVISTGSLEQGSEAAIARSTEQAWRELAFAGNDKKKAFFKKAGIAPGDDLQSRLNKAGPLLEAARAAGKDDLEFLKDSGFGNQNANMKIIQWVNDRRILDKRMKAARAAGDAGRVRGISDRFKAENPGRFADAAETAARLGRGAETVDRDVMRKFAEAGLTREHAINSEFGAAAEGLIDMGGAGPHLLGQDTARHKILDATISAKIKKVVPNAQQRFPDLTPNLTLNPLARPARGERLAEIIRSLSPEERRAVMKEMEAFGAPQPVQQQVAPKAGPGAAAGAAGKAGAAGAGGGHASVDATKLNAAAETMRRAGDALLAAAKSRGGGPHFGGLADFDDEVGPIRG